MGKNFIFFIILHVLLIVQITCDIVGVGSDGGIAEKNFLDEFEISDDRIFVSIASFLDSELTRTVADLIDKSTYGKRLDFGILIQEDLDNPQEFRWEGLPNFNVTRISYLESKGVGWARAKARELYGGQKYILQLDSHHRFARGWDFKLLKAFGRCLELGSKKPILSTYLGGFTGSTTFEIGSLPRKVIAERYYDTGKVRFVADIDYSRKTKDPIPAAIISAHFIFTYGTWFEEIPYDSYIYFDGEEDTLSVRSWTRGWDIYSPPENVIWHLYGREDQKKHWDVHPEWGQIKQFSEARVRQILKQESSATDFGIYGIGNDRSYEDYQEFSGLYFPKWHLGSRAINGDVTVPEINPPPAVTRPKCKYELVNDGEIVEVGIDIWHERHDDDVWTFRKLKEEENGDLILYDISREMYLMITETNVILNFY
eukprot:c15361_g1_i1.p1 GENE.c15361_g1_i1~~c15361_g1_i1.p1  ORF type:complete len:427 (+),score=123.84 c15361_g1_i1:2-1282(+)